MEARHTVVQKHALEAPVHRTATTKGHLPAVQVLFLAEVRVEVLMAGHVVAAGNSEHYAG